MRHLLKFTFFLIVQTSFGQNLTEVKSESFSGAIIPKENYKSGQESFTPTEKEILELENVIVEIQNKKNLKASRHITSEIDFNKYVRQYSGFYIAGEKVISVTFILKEIVEKEKLKWKIDYLYPVKNSVSMNYFIERIEFYEVGICGG